MSKTACGPHTELASNEAVRVTRCSCGTVHVSLRASGVSLRFSEATLRDVAAAFAASVANIDGDERPLPTSAGSTSFN